jgi:hypothetical protein
MTKLIPFADDAASVSIGGLTIENGRNRVALYGSLDLTRDKAGLAHARALQALAEAAVKALEAMSDLPDKAEAPAKPTVVGNPFA